jgi:adenylosuccinate synthase
VVDGEQTVLHVVPAGVLHPSTVNLIGPGVVVDPRVLIAELERLEARGVLRDPSRVRVSGRAHVILEWNVALDKAREEQRSQRSQHAIGTTGRGIGPTYEDKVARRGIRVGDLLDEAFFRQKLEVAVPQKNILLRALGRDTFEVEDVVKTLRGAAERLRPHVADTTLLLHRWMRDGAAVLFEGAQGTLLDVDHGTYPYITTSSASAGGAAPGTGVPPTRIHGVLGVTKAYATRVGAGPFPTEVTGDLGELIRARGKEYGSVTGRPRRCGWFDAPLLRHAVRVNGLDTLAVTKLDVLDPCHVLRVGVGYRYRGAPVDEWPGDERVVAELEPVFEERPGWLSDTAGLRAWEDLPPRARDYLRWIEDLTECEISLVSTGPARDETILLEPSSLTRWFPDFRRLCLA